MDMEDVSRRTVWRAALSICSMAGLGALSVSISACNGSQRSAACAKADALTDGEVKLRESFKYAEQSPDPKRMCAGCAFFRSNGAGAPCGACSVLGGPVNPHGH